MRPARRRIAAGALLYESAKPLLRRVRRHRGPRAADPAPRSTAARRTRRAGSSATSPRPTGEVVGVLAGFPSRRGEELARRFIVLTLPRIPPWRWPGLLRHLQAAGHVAPRPPAGSWYVDALAVARRLAPPRRRPRPARRGRAPGRAQRLDRRGARHRPRQRAPPARSTRPTASSAARCAARPTNASRARSAAPASSSYFKSRPRRVAFRASGPLLRGGSSETSRRPGGRGGARVAPRTPSAPRQGNRPAQAAQQRRSPTCGSSTRTSSARRATST